MNGSPAKSATNNLYIIATELEAVTENHAPILPRPSVVTVKKLTEMVFTNTAVDYDLPAQTLTYELLARPDGATIDSDGIIRWTPTLTQGPSTNRFRAKISDNGSPARSATNVFYAIVTEGNTAPVLYGRSSFTVTNAAGVAETYTATDFADAVEETPPPGWTVGVVSAGGVYDATTGRVRWGLFHDRTARTLTCELTPTGALAPFTGVASFDGTNLPIGGVSQPEIVPAITEAEFAPATRLPTGEIVLPLATRDGTVTVIEFSDDFRVWTPIWTNTPGSQLFRDRPLNVRAGRSYRSSEQ